MSAASPPGRDLLHSVRKLRERNLEKSCEPTYRFSQWNFPALSFHLDLYLNLMIWNLKVSEFPNFFIPLGNTAIRCQLQLASIPTSSFNFISMLNTEIRELNLLFFSQPLVTDRKERWNLRTTERKLRDSDSQVSELSKHCSPRFRLRITDTDYDNSRRRFLNASHRNYPINAGWERASDFYSKTLEPTIRKAQSWRLKFQSCTWETLNPAIKNS